MASNSDVFKGIVRGKVIELERPVNLPDGQEVTVVVQPANGGNRLSPGEGMRRSFAGWADDAVGLDQFLEWNRQQRKRMRRENEQ